MPYSLIHNTFNQIIDRPTCLRDVPCIEMRCKPTNLYLCARNRQWALWLIWNDIVRDICIFWTKICLSWAVFVDREERCVHRGACEEDQVIWSDYLRNTWWKTTIKSWKTRGKSIGSARTMLRKKPLLTESFAAIIPRSLQLTNGLWTITSAVPGGNCMQVDEQWPVHADNVHLIERFHAVDMARASVIRIFAFAAAVVIVSKRGGAGGGNRSSDTGAGSTTPPRNQQIPFF